MPLIAKPYDSGFAEAHDTYNAMTTASDGRIFYVLSSQLPDVAGRMYVLDPVTGATQLCGDLTEACGEKGTGSIAQGKSHVRFVEANGQLFFATHAGYYSLIDGMEKMGIPPTGYQPYPGGHLLHYNLKSGTFTSLAVAPEHEGILTMNMDMVRGLLYAISWPTGYFLEYDLASGKLTNLGPVDGEGEKGAHGKFRSLCRAIAIDPTDGAAYITRPDGTILQYKAGQDQLIPIVQTMKKDYFGQYDPDAPGHMGYHWRQIVWHPEGKVFYGVHGNSGYLFRFDPRAQEITAIERLTSVPSRRSGMFDQFSYGYLGFDLGPDGHTLYYLTGGPIYENGKRITGKEKTAKGEAKGLENLHLITYDLLSTHYTDHGPVFYPDGQRPTYVNSIAVGKDGKVYTMARFTKDGVERTDLIEIIVSA